MTSVGTVEYKKSRNHRNQENWVQDFLISKINLIAERWTRYAL
jgi:hypothetical protein